MTPSTSTFGRSDHWDFIRGLSMAIMVVMHTADLVGWKPFGYQLMRFYYPVIEPIIFLSGFLICMRTLQQVERLPEATGPITKLYALRRVLRTWPLFYIFVIVCFIFPQLQEFPVQKSLLSFLTFTMNWDLPPSGLAHLWTLCLEEWCYFVFLFCIPFLRRPFSSYVFLSLALIPLAIRIYLVKEMGPFNYHDYFTRIHYGTLTHWDSFWWGCFLAPVYLQQKQALSKGNLGLLLAASALILFAYVKLAFNSSQISFLQVTNPLWGAAISALAVWGIHAVPARFLRMTGLVRLGFMSYTFYLTHKVVMMAFIRMNRSQEWITPFSWFEVIATYIFLAIVGTLLFYALEFHLLNLLRRHFSFSGLKSIAN